MIVPVRIAYASDDRAVPIEADGADASRTDELAVRDVDPTAVRSAERGAAVGEAMPVVARAGDRLPRTGDNPRREPGRQHDAVGVRSEQRSVRSRPTNRGWAHTRRVGVRAAGEQSSPEPRTEHRSRHQGSPEAEDITPFHIVLGVPRAPSYEQRPRG